MQQKTIQYSVLITLARDGTSCGSSTGMYYAKSIEELLLDKLSAFRLFPGEEITKVVIRKV